MEKILLSYSGKIDYGVHESLVEEAKNLPDFDNIDVVVKKRLIYIIIEGLENIYKHSDFSYSVKGGAGKDDNFSLANLNDSFIVRNGNQVTAMKAGLLKVKLDYINSLNANSLKEYYNEIITNGLVSENSGAGLGMIRISLKSNSRINYSLEKLETDLYYFNMWVILPKLLKTI